ncbi:hypothetical protein E8E13_007628 [Curvularia kusanoi]|uniref:Luciferase domain-containing protein n=1 Tax=Curvularia kusanoi TaxID=90978 RepID=A0A9P4WDP2_CURKU|nr:hypothetical protein E8E13_007628 [Curvularia kusanoi]
MASNWSNWVIATSTVAVLAIYYDFKSWQNYGTGGTPPTFQGYLKIRRWGLYLLYKRQDLFDPLPIPDTGVAYIKPGKVLERTGSPPKTIRWTLPQRQYPEPITKSALDELTNLMQAFASTAPYSEYIETRASKTEGGTGPAIYVKPDVKTINPVAHKIFYEVAHVHPKENSLHVYVSPKDARTVVSRGWGKRFPVTWLAPPSWIMVYAPRNERELEVVKEIVRAAICHAVGMEVSSPKP